MKFNRIYISAFGTLKDFSLDFTEGLQVIYGENEAGKTTITEFIKAMFYGTGRRAAGQAMSTRERYTPWSGTPAGGRIYFEHSGREYCLEKQFRKSDATDKATITDMASGKVEACACDIGKQLFGISLAAFERSVFIGNTPEFSHDIEAQGEINQRLSNAALSGEDGVSHQKVLNRIEDARLKLISKSGRTGSAISDINECNALIAALDEADRAARKKKDILNEITRVDGEIKALGTRYEDAQKVLDSAKDIENAQKLKEYCSLKDKLDGITEQITLADGTVADEMFIKKIEFGFSKLDNMRERLEGEKEELARLNAAAAGRADASPAQIKEKIVSAQKEKAELENKESTSIKALSLLESEIKELETAADSAKLRKKAVNPALLIIGIAVILVGAAIYLPLKSVLLPALVCAAGAVLTLLSFVFRPADSAAAGKAQARLEAKGAELTAARADLTVLRGEKNNIDARIASLNVSLNFGIKDEERIKDFTAKIEAGENTLAAEREKTLRFFGLSADTDISALAEKISALREKAEEQKQIKLRLSYLGRDLKNISYDKAREKLASIKDTDVSVDLDAQKQEAASILSRKSAAENLKTRLETELKTGFRGMRNPEDLRREINLLKEKIAAKQAFYDAAGIAYDVLSESLIEARRTFGSVLENETLKNLKAITRGAYGSLNISSDFDISAEKSGTFGTHDAEYLSRGTKDQVYLALRLAVSKLISDSEPLPVILDDALSQYDDKRFLSALEFLREYSANAQILLFTCHNFILSAAKQANISTINI